MTCEGCGGLPGGHSSDHWRPSSDVGQAAAPGGLRRPKHPRVKKKTNKGSHNNHQVVEDAWERQEDVRGCINTIKL